MSSASATPLEWVSPVTDSSDDEMAARGLIRIRSLYQMRRALPLEDELRSATRQVQLRSFIPGQDDRGFLAVNNRAFEWHPDQGGWGPDQLNARMSEPWFDPTGFLIHESEVRERPGQIDGFCWTKIHAADGDDPAMGEIFVIAADPSTHGTGLGRALTVAGLDLLAKRGLEVGMLYVESDNLPAVNLYERLGFTIHHTDAAYAGNSNAGGPDSAIDGVAP